MLLMVHLSEKLSLPLISIVAVVIVISFEAAKVICSPGTTAIAASHSQNRGNVNNHYHQAQVCQSTDKLNQLNKIMTTPTSVRILRCLLFAAIFSFLPFDNFPQWNEIITRPKESNVDPIITCDEQRRGRHAIGHHHYIGVLDTTAQQWKVNWDIAKTDMTQLSQRLLKDMGDACLVQDINPKINKTRYCFRDSIVHAYFTEIQNTENGLLQKLVKAAYKNYTKPCRDEDEQALKDQILSEKRTQAMRLFGLCVTLALVACATFRVYGAAKVCGTLFRMFAFCIVRASWCCGRAWRGVSLMLRFCSERFDAIHQAIIGWINARRDTRRQLVVQPLTQYTQNAHSPLDEPFDSAWFERFKILHISRQKAIVNAVYGCDAPKTKKDIREKIQAAKPEDLQRMRDVAKAKKYIV
jgi:hypothetical protein